MESIIAQLTDPQVWEDMLAYRLRKGRYSWHEFDAADRLVAERGYLEVARRLQQGEPLSLPRKTVINKMGTSKKRVVYTYAPDEMQALSLIAFLLYRYDDRFAPNCYAFRRGMRPQDAIRHLNRIIHGRALWAYKLDIHDYFNSIDIELLLPMLREMLNDDEPLFGSFERMLTSHQAVLNGAILEEPHGIMAGTPTSPFLANVFLSAVDHHFAKAGVVYARYSDDIILFAPDRETLEQHKTTLLGFLDKLHLTVNPEKEHVYKPDEPYEFLGFRCHEGKVDISRSTVNKMKGKIRRRARSLMRWRKRKGASAERAMRAMIRHFNGKFFEGDDPESLTWSRWFFPVINQTEGLKEIDHYLQQQIRFLSTGRHTKINYRVDYETLKRWGYRSLVNEFHKATRNQSQK